MSGRPVSSLTVAEMVAKYPEIAWKEPQSMLIMGGAGRAARSGFVCRICVGQKGFRPSEDTIYDTADECVAHIACVHPEV